MKEQKQYITPSFNYRVVKLSHILVGSEVPKEVPQLTEEFFDLTNMEQLSKQSFFDFSVWENENSF